MERSPLPTPWRWLCSYTSHTGQWMFQKTKKDFKENNVNFQLVPPNTHRRNAAKRSIQTWKNYFFAGLATCDTKTPIKEWDLLLPQSDTTLNLLRTYRRFPRLSSYKCLNQKFNFAAIPIALPGTRVVSQISTNQCRHMAPHGIDGWYVEPSIQHYLCHKCCIPSNHVVQDVMTINWFPSTTPFHKFTTDDYLRQTYEYMLSIIQAKETRLLPEITFWYPITNAFIKIA